MGAMTNSKIVIQNQTESGKERKITPIIRIAEIASAEKIISFQFFLIQFMPLLKQIMNIFFVRRHFHYFPLLPFLPISPFFIFYFASSLSFALTS